MLRFHMRREFGFDGESIAAYEAGWWLGVGARDDDTDAFRLRRRISFNERQTF